MSRRPTDHPFALDDTAWLASRLAPQSAPDQTAIFYNGTEGNDRLLGSNFDDYFDMSQGGDDRVTARTGDDVIYFGAAFTGADRVDGGSHGTAGDLVILDGDYSGGISVEKKSFQNIEMLGLNGGSFAITGFLGFGGRYEDTIVDASSLTKHQSLSLDVSSLGDLIVRGGAGDDVIHGSENHHVSTLSGATGDDTLIGSGGRTTFSGGSGADHIVMANDKDRALFVKSDSTGSAYDVIEGFRGIADGAKNTIALFFDSDDVTPNYQSNFHLGATPGHVGDIVAQYDASIDHTVINVFTDADDTPDFVMHLTGDVTLSIKDFQF